MYVISPGTPDREFPEMTIRVFDDPSGIDDPRREKSAFDAAIFRRAWSVLIRFFEASILATRRAVNDVADKFVPVTSPVTVSGEESVDAVAALLNITKLFDPPVNPRDMEFVVSPDPLYVKPMLPEFPLKLSLPNLIGIEFMAADMTLRVTAPNAADVVIIRIPSVIFDERFIPFNVVEVAEKPAFAETSPEAVTVVAERPAFAETRPEAVTVVAERPAFAETSPEAVTVVAERPAFAETSPEAVMVVVERPAFAETSPEAVTVVVEKPAFAITGPCTVKPPELGSSVGVISSA